MKVSYSAVATNTVDAPRELQDRVAVSVLTDQLLGKEFVHDEAPVVLVLMPSRAEGLDLVMP